MQLELCTLIGHQLTHFYVKQVYDRDVSTPGHNSFTLPQKEYVEFGELFETRLFGV